MNLWKASSTWTGNLFHISNADLTRNRDNNLLASDFLKDLEKTRMSLFNQFGKEWYVFVRMFKSSLRLLYFKRKSENHKHFREGRRYQIRWIFEKNSKLPSTPPPFSKNYIVFFSEKVRKKPFIKVQNLQYKFLDLNWLPPPPLL